MEEEGKPAPDATRAFGNSPEPQATAAFSAASPAPPEALAVGATLDDFLLMDRLGQGAFATVYLAHQQSMRRTVALKVSESEDAEAQTLAQLDHPNIVRVYDQRNLPQRGVHLVWMEYLPGGTLEELGGVGFQPRHREREIAVGADTLDGRADVAVEVGLQHVQPDQDAPQVRGRIATVGDVENGLVVSGLETLDGWGG